MISDLVKVAERVEYLLREFPKTRDSDKALWLGYNVLFNGLKDVMNVQEYNHFRRWLMRYDTPVFESLSRARRKIQEDNPSLAGDKDKRMQEAENVREWARK